MTINLEFNKMIVFKKEINNRLKHFIFNYKILHLYLISNMALKENNNGIQDT